MSDIKDMRWTVIGEGTKSGYVLCRCSCAAKTEKEIYKYNLRAGKSLSCGCLHSERTSQRGRTHADTCGGVTTTEYRIWASMLARCYTPSASHYESYGGVGISVCDRWRTSFVNFLEDMGRRPGAAYSLDRVDNDGNYEPANCRWATRAQQARNKSTNRHVTIGDRTQVIGDWIVELKLSTTTVYRRLSLGWDVVAALTAPPRPKRPPAAR